MSRSRYFWTGLLAVAVLALPPLRQLLEADMTLHMLLQFPLLIVAGVLIGLGLPASIKARLAPWNRHGIAGLLLASLVAAFWMIPRALDEVLLLPWLEACKFVSLSLGVGSALALSWRAAGFLVQGFFLGNLLPMMTVVGWLYLEAPVRLCNAYLGSQQEDTGSGLIWLSIFAALLWLVSFFTPSATTTAPSSQRPCNLQQPWLPT